MAAKDKATSDGTEATSDSVEPTSDSVEAPSDSVEATPGSIEGIVQAAVTSAIAAMRAEDYRRAELVMLADLETEAVRIKEEDEQAARNAARPSRRNDVTMEQLDAVMSKFRAGSTIRIRGHRGFKAFAWRDGDSRSDPAPFINVRPDDEVDLPIHQNSERNQTPREMAHMHLAGFYEPI